jgi:tartrate-resistant acid phosphatase type 5
MSPSLRASALPALIWLGACGQGTPPSPPDRGSAPADAKVRFIAIGDPGTGSANQFAVGAAMAQVCELRGCDFVVELGDNIYLSGVSSVYDEQFETKFEQPYATLDVPFFLVLGNHDNSIGPGEGSSNRRGDFQVDYHYRSDRTSNKWNMPARYYTFTAPLGSDAPLIEFWGLDSNPLAAIVPDLDPAWLWPTYGAAQLQWLLETSQASQARWKIAMSHHPYLSNGLHGNAGSADGTNPLVPGTISAQPWKDFIEAGVCAEGFDLHLQGHDHDLEWIKPQPQCGDTHFIVSGAADSPRTFGDAARNEVFYQQDQVLGFFWFEVSRDALLGAVYQLDEAQQPQVAFEKTLVK